MCLSFNGSAIFTFAHKSNAQLTQKGHFIGQTGVPSFIDCRYGIFADRCKVVSEHNIMQGMTNAYRVQLNKHDIFIRHNNIDSHRDAIQLLLNDGSPNVVVYDNDIVFGNSDAGQSYCAIRVNEFNIPAANSRINYNRINFRPGATAATTGIFTNATNGWVITNNEIEMDDNRYNLDGIFMMDNERTIASCNIVTGNGDYDVIQQSAIRVLMGDDYMIGCNTLDKTQNAVFIQSPMQNLTIQGNNFNEHFNAFRYGVNAVTNDQDLLGNIWHDQTPPAGGMLALNEYQLWNPFNTNEVGPGTNTYPVNTYQNPPDWFLPDVGDNFQCEDSVTVYCNDFPIDMGRTYSEFEILIAGDSIENDPYTDETRWLLKKRLYERLEENPAWLNDSVFFSFYWDMMYSPTATLRSVDIDKKQLYMIDSITEAQADLTRYLTWLYNSLAMAKVTEVLDSVMANNYPATKLYEINLLQQTITALQFSGDSIVMAMEAQRNVIADVALGKNSSINASKEIEGYEKSINEIYLSTVGKGIYNFTPPQIQTIFFIAHLCPLAGGAAVSRARSLYSLINPYEKYDDKTVCFQAGISIRQQKPKPKWPEFRLYPNPARTAATLEYELPSQVTGELILLDISGRPLISHYLPKGKAKFEFATDNMKPGIYFYLVRSQNLNVHTGKLIIVQ